MEIGEVIFVYKVVFFMYSDFFKVMFIFGFQEVQVFNLLIKFIEYFVDIVKGILKFMYIGCLLGILEFKIFLKFKFSSYRINIVFYYYK